MTNLRDPSKIHPFGSFDPLLTYYDEIKSFEVKLKFHLITDLPDMGEANQLIQQHLSAGYHFLFEFAEKGIFGYTLVLTFGKPKSNIVASIHNYPYIIQPIQRSRDLLLTDALGKRVMIFEHKNYNSKKPEEFLIFRDESKSKILFSSVQEDFSNNDYEVVRLFRGDRGDLIGQIERKAVKGGASVVCSSKDGKPVLALHGQSVPELIYTLADGGGLFWVCIRQYKGLLRNIMFRAGYPGWRSKDEEAIILLAGLWSFSKLNQRYILQ